MNKEVYELIRRSIGEITFQSLPGSFNVLNKDLYPNERTFIRKSYLELEDNKDYRLMLKEHGILNINCIRLAEYNMNKTIENGNIVVRKNELYLTSDRKIIEVLMTNVIVPLDKNDIDLSLKKRPYERYDIKYEVLNKDWYKAKYYYKNYDFSKHNYYQMPFENIVRNLDKRLTSLQKRIDKINDLKYDLINLKIIE